MLQVWRFFGLFAYVLFVMLPVVKITGDAELAWQMGLAACFGSGLIELAGAWIGARVKRVTPRAAMLAMLAAMLACLLDGRFRTAANWSFAAALFSSIGMIHGYPPKRPLAPSEMPCSNV